MHAKRARRIIENRVKDCGGSKHKGGKFYLRWCADKIGVFLEVALVEDLLPVKRKIPYNLDQKNT